MLFSFAFKNIRSRKSSFAICLFISAAMAFLFIVNAVFDGTEQGIQKAFVRSFTGNIVIRPISKYPLSLFGDETPVTGDLTQISQIDSILSVIPLIENHKAVEYALPQLTAYAALEKDEYRINTALFGVEAESYVKAMTGIRILEGKPYKPYEKGIMISKKTAGSTIKTGDTIQLVTADAGSFRIRAVPVSAIYEYEVENQILDRISLLDPVTLRSLKNVANVAYIDDSLIEEQSRNLLSKQELDSIDDLFSEFSDVNAVVSDTEHINIQIDASAPQTAWNFIVCTVKDDHSVPLAIADLNRLLKKNSMPVEAVNWRKAAGATATYMYILRLILNSGIIVVLLAGFIVVSNTLTINVLDRIKEIGTMRAIGAKKSLIALLFFIETCMLTFISAFIGIIMGFIGNLVLSALKIPIANSLLQQLFGGNVLSTVVTYTNILSIFILALFLGILGWLFPVQNALDITPVTAMRGAN